MVSKYWHLSMSQFTGIYLLLLYALGCESSTKYSNDWTEKYSNDWTETIVVNDRYRRLQLLNPDTGETVIIKDSSKAYAGLRWSPDGQFIAYSGQSIQDPMSHQIYVTNRFGEGNQTITLWEYEGGIEESHGYAEKPVWSPDGSLIAFRRYFDPHAIADIYIATSDPSSGLYEDCLTPDIFDDIPYDWTPDGSRILFGSNGLPDGTFDPDGGRDLYLMNIDGTSKYRFLESDSTFSIRGARYSQDGTQIAFIVSTIIGTGLDHDWINSIYIINADGTDLRRVLELGMAGNTYIKIKCLSWAPDGMRLAFTAGEKPWEGDHVYIIDVDGTNQTQITSGEHIYFDLDWRPGNESY